MGGCWGLGLESLAEPRLCHLLAGEREIVSGMEIASSCTYRKGVKSECGGTRRRWPPGGLKGRREGARERPASAP